jgi:hypothetical protein
MHFRNAALRNATQPFSTVGGPHDQLFFFKGRAPVNIGNRGYSKFLM